MNPGKSLNVISDKKKTPGELQTTTNLQGKSQDKFEA